MKVETTEVRNHWGSKNAISHIAGVKGIPDKTSESHKRRLIRLLWPNAHGPAFQTSTSACSPDTYGRSCTERNSGRVFTGDPRLTRKAKVVSTSGRGEPAQLRGQLGSGGPVEEEQRLLTAAGARGRHLNRARARKR